jgi:hypothetical protein
LRSLSYLDQPRVPESQFRRQPEASQRVGSESYSDLSHGQTAYSDISLGFENDITVGGWPIHIRPGERRLFYIALAGATNYACLVEILPSTRPNDGYSINASVISLRPLCQSS